MQQWSGGGFDTPIRWDYSFYAERIVSKYARIFRGQLSDSGTQSKFWIRPVSIKRTNLQKSSTGKPALESPTVMSVERSAPKWQSPRPSIKGNGSLTICGHYIEVPILLLLDNLCAAGGLGSLHYTSRLPHLPDRRKLQNLGGGL